MEVQNADFTGGSLQISIGVLARIAKLAALEVKGVLEVKSAPAEVKTLLTKKGATRSVNVALQDGIAEITVGIVVAYGHKIPSVCARVQEAIKSSVQNMSGITVSRVNVIVVGVGTVSAPEEA